MTHPAPPGTPTPTPRPVQRTAGYISPGDYLSTVFENLKTSDLSNATNNEWLNFFEEVRDEVVASEL